MRKIRIIDQISLDGVIQQSADENDFPYGNWTARYRTPAGRELILAAYGEDVYKRQKQARRCGKGDSDWRQGVAADPHGQTHRKARTKSAACKE